MKCEKCGAALPVNAKFCDQCGAKIYRETYKERTAREAREREKARKKKLAAKISAAVVMLILIISVWNIFIPHNREYDPDLYSIKNSVTAAEYGRLSEGMTYDQITDIIGEGAKASSWGTPFDGFVIYQWPGEYLEEGGLYSDLKIYVDRTTKKADLMSEINIVDGEVVRDNLAETKKAVSERTAEDVRINIGYGATYREVADFMGIDGLLTNSESNSRGNDNKTFTWNVDDGYDSTTKVDIHFENNKVTNVS